MAIVQCPECSKKLKVADTSVGKKVKCSCGHIFVAEAPDALGLTPGPKPVPAVPPEKVLVACTECGAQLKVATTSLGKKMKCPKCAGVFVAAVEEEPVPTPKAGRAADDDMDELLNFAHSESKPDEDENLDDMDEDLPKPKGKARKPAADDDEDLAEPEPDAKPVYPSRLLVNLFVFFLVLAYAGFFGAVYFVPIDLGFAKQKGAAILRQPPQDAGKLPIPFKKDAGGPSIDKKNVGKKDFGKGKKEDLKKEDAKADNGKKDDDSKKDDLKKDDGKKDDLKKDDSKKDDVNGARIDLHRDGLRLVRSEDRIPNPLTRSKKEH